MKGIVLIQIWKSMLWREAGNDLEGDQSLRLVARFGSYNGDSPGYLQEQAKDDPKQSADFANQDGDKQTTHFFSSHWSKDLYFEGLAINLKAYHQSFQRERWVRFSEAGSLQNRYDDHSKSV